MRVLWIAACAAFALVAVAAIGVALTQGDGSDGDEHRVTVPNVTRNVTDDGTPSPTATPSIPTATPTREPSPSPTLAGTPQALETVQLTVSDGQQSRSITVQVADEGRERQIGLMWVTAMQDDEGMLFVFGRDSSAGFWMRNTYIPLDIAYLAADGTVLEVHHGNPLDETQLTPGQPYRYTLEMNAGWFERNGFEPGTTVVTIPASIGG